MKYIFVLTLLICTLLCFSAAERPAHCYEPHPRGQGPCRMLIFGYYFNPETNQCEQYQEGGCSAVGGHHYETQKECDADCIATAE